MMGNVRSNPPGATTHTPLTRGRDYMDAWLAALLFLLAIETRYLYMMRLPYAWDSFLYIRALDGFNPTIQQPQPPGYISYVSAARLMEALTADPNRALVWVSVVASGAAVAALYLLARLLYDRLTGLVAAGMLLTSVTFWFYGEVAYPYTTLAAGSVVIALLALSARRGLLPGARSAALAAGAFGLVGGFRQDLLLFGAPLFIAALWRRPPRDWIAAFVAGSLAVLSWLLPSAVLSGGLTAYLDASARQGGMATGGSGIFNSLAGLRANIHEIGIFLWRGLYVALLPLAYFLLRWLAGVVWGVRDPARGWLLLWLTPPLAFYVFGHIGDYGYTMSVLPALLTLAARGVVVGAGDAIALVAGARRAIHARVPASLARRREGARLALTILLGAGLIAGNGALFVRRQSQLSVAGIRCYEATMQARLEIVRRRFRPEDTLIFSSAYYQHVRYFLPQYPSWFYEPASGPADQRTMPAGTRVLIIFDETIRPAAGVPGVTSTHLPCNDVPFYWIAVRAGDVVRYDGVTLRITVQSSGRLGDEGRG